MPAWLAKAPAAPTAAQRWGRRFMFLGAAMLAVALAGGATMLGLDLYESHASMEVVASSSQASPVQAAPAGTLPFVDKRPSSVPPLVLLPPDPNAKKDVAAPVAAPTPVKEVAAAAAAAAAAVAAPPVAVVKKTPAAVAAAPAKPAAAPAVQSAPAAQVAAKPVSRAKIATARKPATTAKRPAKPLLARAKTVKPVKGTMLQPPRDRLDERARDDERPAPRQAIDRRCRPGELARECEARTR